MIQQPIKQKPKSNNFIYKRSRLRPGPILSDNAQSPQVQHYRNIGNQAVQRLLESRALQAKLKIGSPNDKYEQEADSVADQVIRMKEESLVNGHWSLGRKEDETSQTKPLAEQVTPLVQRQPDEEEEELKTKPLLQRQADEEKEEDEEIKPKLMDNHQLQRQELPEEEEEEEPVQTKLMGDDKLHRQGYEPEKEEDFKKEEEETSVLPKATPGSTHHVSPNIESSINSMKGGGQPLSDSTRAFFEPRFGADFSKVRVHTDSRAAETAQTINAKAFTIGKDIAFNSGKYSPNTTPGKHLLAHELTHVMQQNRMLPPYTLQTQAEYIQKPTEILPTTTVSVKLLSDEILLSMIEEIRRKLKKMKHGSTEKYKTRLKLNAYLDEASRRNRSISQPGNRPRQITPSTFGESIIENYNAIINFKIIMGYNYNKYIYYQNYCPKRVKKILESYLPVFTSFSNRAQEFIQENWKNKYFLAESSEKIHHKIYKKVYPDYDKEKPEEEWKKLIPLNELERHLLTTSLKVFGKPILKAGVKNALQHVIKNPNFKSFLELSSYILITSAIVREKKDVNIVFAEFENRKLVNLKIPDIEEDFELSENVRLHIKVEKLEWNKSNNSLEKECKAWFTKSFKTSK